MKLSALDRYSAVILCLAIAASTLILMSTRAHAQGDNRLDTTNQSINYTFICEDNGSGLSAVDVLQASGEHSRFLELLNSYDPEGFTILTDDSLSDKTIWAPTDTAFQSVEDHIDEMNDDEIKAILGYHISPPQSSPSGDYEIITPDYLKRNSPETFRTRTGVLTGSDQRITSHYDNEKLLIEDAEIRQTSWCNEAGSIFSLDHVILSIEPPSALTKIGNRIYRMLLYDDIRFIIYSVVGATALESIIGVTITKKSKK